MPTWRSATISASYDYVWARNAIFQGLRCMNLAPGSSVLVPAFICSSVVDAIIGLGLTVRYYDVTSDCTIVRGSIEDAHDRMTAAVLGVHYFGFPQTDMQWLREFCDGKAIALIEDCAHVLDGSCVSSDIGSIGDMSVYSWRKFLPVDDGGTLRVNCSSKFAANPELCGSSLVLLKSAKSCLPVTHRTHVLSPLSATTQQDRSRPLRKFIWDLLGEQQRAYFDFDSNSDAFFKSVTHLSATAVARWIFRHSDVDEIVKVRRSNWTYLSQALANCKSVSPLHHDLPPGVCPWIFALRILGQTNAHLILRRLGVPAVTWGGVRPASVNFSLHPVAGDLYDNLIFLPVHQSLTERDLLTISTCVVKVGESTRDEIDYRLPPQHLI